MNTNTPQKRNPGNLFILALCAGLGLCMSGGAIGAEDGNDLYLGSPLVKKLVDGDMQVMKVGHRSGLHMSLKSSTRETGADYTSPVADNRVTEHGVHLSYRLSW